jgi:hypothetical protein
MLGKQTVSNPISVAKFVLELSIRFSNIKAEKLAKQIDTLD